MPDKPILEVGEHLDYVAYLDYTATISVKHGKQDNSQRDRLLRAVIDLTKFLLIMEDSSICVAKYLELPTIDNSDNLEIRLIGKQSSRLIFKGNGEVEVLLNVATCRKIDLANVVEVKYTAIMVWSYVQTKDN